MRDRESGPQPGRARDVSEKDRIMILAGDIGGTNSRLASFEVVQERVKPIVEETFPSRGSASLDDIVRTFVSKHNLRITHACFGIAGPIRHGRSEAINLAWVVDGQSLAQQLGLATVGLINDLEANAYGAAALAPEDFAILNEARQRPKEMLRSSPLVQVWAKPVSTGTVSSTGRLPLKAAMPVLRQRMLCK